MMVWQSAGYTLLVITAHWAKCA